MQGIFQCGEGSHLQRIIEGSNIPATGIGLDISKDGILLASKRYENSIWIVGDLAKSPFGDQSFHIILNILSPSNYKEFKRLLVQDGLVIKVVPRPDYLKELREVLYDDMEKKSIKTMTPCRFLKGIFLSWMFSLYVIQKILITRSLTI